MNSPTGLEITVSNNILCQNNYIHDNTVGVGLYHPHASGNPPKDVMANWMIMNNKIWNNNFLNTADHGVAATLPSGVGILAAGVSDHTICQNDIRNNNQVGIAVIGWCTGTGDCNPATENPYGVEHNHVDDNFFKDNGLAPDPLVPFPPVDILFAFTPGIESGDGNCFENNIAPPDGITSFPEVLPSCD